MSRWKAFGIHLALSAAIALTFAIICRYFWFDGPLFEIAGAVGLLLILVPVDTVLGPLLTLIVFKSGKPRLSLDLSVIGFIQLAALIYGAYVMIQVRPLYGVLYANQLRAVQFEDVQSGWFDAVFQRTRYVEISEAEVGLPEIEEALSALTGSTPVYFKKDLYHPVTSLGDALLKHAKPIDSFKSQTIRNGLTARMSKKGVTAFWVIPVIARGAKHWGIVNPETGEMIEVVPASEI